MTRLIYICLLILIIFILVYLYSISMGLGWNVFLIAYDYINASESIYNTGKQMIQTVNTWAPIAFYACIVTLFLIAVLLLMYSLRSQAERGGGGFWPF